MFKTGKISSVPRKRPQPLLIRGNSICWRGVKGFRRLAAGPPMIWWAAARNSAYFNLRAPAEHCECSFERRDLGRVLWVEHAPCLFLVHLHGRFFRDSPRASA